VLDTKKSGLPDLDLATEFVSELPDKKLSSAAVQGYLLKKKDPREAVRDIPSWIVEERVIPAFDAGDESRGPNIANVAAADSCADDTDHNTPPQATQHSGGLAA
jgi:hypothetical protein